MGLSSDDFCEAGYDKVKEHMEDQPWQVTCRECGVRLDDSTDATVDGDLDLSVQVDRCTCATEEIEKLQERVDELEQELEEKNDDRQASVDLSGWPPRVEPGPVDSSVDLPPGPVGGTTLPTPSPDAGGGDSFP